MVNKSIKLFLVIEVLIIATKLISFSFFINLQVAFLSSFFVILGSAYAHRKMVISDIENENIGYERDFLDEVEDPHELYDDVEINNAPAEELNLKEIVQEERKKIKTFSAKSMKKGVKASSSLFRLIPYIFLILGFIALKNNDLLDIMIYLPSLMIGIIIGSISSKSILS
jgi:hypothetical protein